MAVFRWRHFAGKIILWAVRWYCRYGISYRELEEMMGERGVAVDHTTLYRRARKSNPPRLNGIMIKSAAWAGDISRIVGLARVSINAKSVSFVRKSANRLWSRAGGSGVNNVVA